MKINKAEGKFPAERETLIVCMLERVSFSQMKIILKTGSLFAKENIVGNVLNNAMSSTSVTRWEEMIGCARFAK
jgi:hypothetical protein